uniref:Transmembrane protein 184C n=1 Tax=Strigamia maritima TaxID=126957 RepID=T1JIJ2_STRMM
MTLPIALWEISQHLVHYTKPYLQKHVIRILWMVPIYALNAWLALLFPEGAIYMDTVRECYEAYVIYNFMIYLLNFLNSNLDLEEVLENKEQIRHFIPMCCLSNWRNGRELIQRCKHGILQYTVVRPVVTVIALICELAGVYEENQFTGKNAYTYIVCINNFSQFISMYCLVLFYKATREELQPMRPIAKFLCIKAVIFFSFFQGFIIAILVATGAIKEAFTADDHQAKIIANSLQDFLICIEMFLAAIAHLYAFSYRPYVDPEAEQVPCCDSFWSMWDVSDVHRDIKDHIRVVGSTVKRQVTRIRTSESVEDERTRLISSGPHRALEQPGSTSHYQSLSEPRDQVLTEAEAPSDKTGNIIILSI